VGVSENIVEASWQAIVDSLEYYFNNHLDALDAQAAGGAKTAAHAAGAGGAQGQTFP